MRWHSIILSMLFHFILLSVLYYIKSVGVKEWDRYSFQHIQWKTLHYLWEKNLNARTAALNFLHVRLAKQASLSIGSYKFSFLSFTFSLFILHFINITFHWCAPLWPFFYPFLPVFLPKIYSSVIDSCTSIPFFGWIQAFLFILDNMLWALIAFLHLKSYAVCYLLTSTIYQIFVL